MGVSQDCPGGIGDEVSTESECREAARELRLPEGVAFAGFWPSPSCHRNCLVHQNKVWFNYGKNMKYENIE